ncbi:MAG TPA: aspartate/glutamate racemase family protein [Thermoanaerobaculia bacterium]|jgi:glutamate racemase
MHILITDSGVGGLSVVAYAERFVRTRGAAEPVRLTFANASPANDYGYNSMPTREEKLATFDHFLRSVTERFAPDSIYIACNTLSVLLPDTPYAADPLVPVRGLVETGASLLLAELARDPRSVAMIFATQTTIDAGTYPRILAERGIERSRIVAQACPGLADTISEDRDGTKTAAEIRRWVDAAVAKMERRDVPVVASLNCTHYGYRKDLFAAALREAGVDARVVDPNERAAAELFAQTPAGPHREVEVRFVTRYAIPAATIEALTFFLADISPRTVNAMQHFSHDPALF